MMTLMRIACLFSWLAAAPLLCAQQEWVVTAKTIYTASGEPIENGFGKVRVGDSLWRDTGGDAAAGTRVRVTGVDGVVLVVEPVD